MSPWILLAIAAVIALLVVANRLRWIDFSNKNRSSGSHDAAFGALDEVFSPTRHEAQIELDRQTILPAPAPLAGDGDKGVFGGKVTIDLDETDRQG